MPNIHRRCCSDEERVINRELFTAIHKGDLNRVKSLLEDEVQSDITDRNNKDNTPLHYAVEKNKKDIVEELLQPKWKTKINLQNKLGNTPLHIATNDHNIELVRLLLDNNAEPGVKNNEKKTPLEIAQHFNWQDGMEILKSFIVQTQQHSLEQPLQQNCSETSYEEVKSKDRYLKQTSFSHLEEDMCSERKRKLSVVSKSNLLEVKHLIDVGVDVDFELEDSNTPLDIAKKHDENEIFEVMGKKIIKNSFQIITEKSQKSILSQSQEKEEKIEEKIRKKVEFALDALEELTQGGDIKRFTHKNVNIFILFLEAFALQDVEINNKLSTDEKNKLIEQYFGKEDNEIIKNIREQFLKSGENHIKKKIISPLYLQNFVPKINGKVNVEVFFINLRDYVQSVYDKLCENTHSELNKKDIKTILQSNSKQKIKCKETERKVFVDLLKEAYSKTPEHQDKGMFDLIVNIIPLFDENLKDGFEELRNLRHDLIHNFHRYRDPYLRLKEFKRVIFDIRSKLFKYYAAQEIHREFSKAPLDQKLDKIMHNFRKVLESLQDEFQDTLTLSERETKGSFEHVFSESLFTERADDVEDLVGKYLRFFAVIDNEERGHINDEEESDILKHYRELSDVERREIFEDFVRLEEIKEFDDQYQIKKANLKKKFGKYGIEEYYFDNTIEFSLEGKNAFGYDLAVGQITGIVKGLLSLKISRELTEYTILNQDIISLYDSFLQEEFKGEIFSLNNNVLLNYYLSENAKQFIKKNLSKLINREECINIPSKGIQINIAKVVNNILKTFYNAYHKYQIKFDNLEAAFSDRIFLYFLVSQDIEKNTNLGFEQQIFNFKDKNYIFWIIKKLLKEDYTAPYITNLITKAHSDEVIEEDDLRRLIQILCKNNTYIMYLSELLYISSRKPNLNLYEVVYEVFEIRDISAESMHVLLGNHKHAKEMINILHQRIDCSKGYIPDETIESTKSILKMLNYVIVELIYKSKTDSALEIIYDEDKNDTSKSPVQLLYKKLFSKGFIETCDTLFVEYQLNIAKAKITAGQQKMMQNKQEARKLYEEALKILKEIPINESPITLLALSRKAYTNTLLKNYDDSHKEICDLYKLVIKIALGSDMVGAFNIKESFSQIQNSKSYENLLGVSSECKKYLNILSINVSIAYNEFHQGVRRSEEGMKKEAIEDFQKALKTCKGILSLEREAPQDDYKIILQTRRRMVQAYRNIAQLILNDPQTRNSEALWYFFRALQEATAVYRKERDILGVWGISNSKRTILDILGDIAFFYNKFGERSSHEYAQDHHKKALDIFKKVYSIQKDLLGEKNRVTLKTKSNMAFSYFKLGEVSSDKQERQKYFNNAQKLNEEIYNIQRDCLGIVHKDTLKTKKHLNILRTKRSACCISTPPQNPRRPRGLPEGVGLLH